MILPILLSMIHMLQQENDPIHPTAVSTCAWVHGLELACLKTQKNLQQSQHGSFQEVQVTTLKAHDLPYMEKLLWGMLLFAVCL